jgi:hypothetical protein
MMFSKGRDMCKEMEVVWAIYGIWLFNRFYGIKKFHGRGQKDSVTFSWKIGLGHFVLGWEHTHPESFGCNPSSTDDRTMRSWVKGKGKAMICGIYCDRKEEWYLYRRGKDRTIWRSLLEVKEYFNILLIGSENPNLWIKSVKMV